VDHKPEYVEMPWLAASAEGEGFASSLATLEVLFAWRGSPAWVPPARTESISLTGSVWLH